MSELLKGEYIEDENVEVESNKTINSLLGALCAILISFITAIYSLIWQPGEKAYEQFFSGFIEAISAGCLIIGIILIFYTWVKYSQKNLN